MAIESCDLSSRDPNKTFIGSGSPGKENDTPPCSGEELVLPTKLGASEERVRWWIRVPWFLKDFVSIVCLESSF